MEETKKEEKEDKLDLKIERQKFQMKKKGMEDISSSVKEVSTSLGGVSESIEKLAESLSPKEIGDGASFIVKGLKGDKGDKGDKGETGIQGKKGDKGDSIKGDKGEQGIPGKKGGQGLKGDKGESGLNGKDGKNGIDGKDGSPDSPDEIVSKLQGVKKQWLSIEAIDGDFNTKVTKVINQLGTTTGLKEVAHDSTLSGSGTDADPLIVIGGGDKAFTDLTDVPNSYTGQGGKVVAVKADVSGLEFIAATDTDEKVKYDASDPTAGYVADKIVAGTGISVAEGSGATENKLVITNSNPTPYSLPTATDSILGGVKVGTTLGIVAGVLNYTNPNPTPYSLPTAAAGTLGGIKVGSRLSIDGSGVLSADVQPGAGDVFGPGVAVDSNFASFDTTTGKLIKDSGYNASSFMAAGSVTQYTDEMAQDAVGNAVGNGLDYDDSTGAISVDTSELTLPFLKLDQSTPETVQGRPIFDDGLQLGLTPTVGTHADGKMFWDATWKTPACELEDDVTLQIGQETMAYVYNGTASPITQGTVVYTSGTQSGVPSVSLAQGDADATSQVLGVVTSTSIDPGAYGYATIRGHVNNIDTSAWNLNDNLYLDSSVAGMLTNVKPNTGDYDTRVGRVMLKDASTGRVYINIIREYKVGAVSAGAGVELFPDDTIITAAGTQSTYPIKTLSKTPITTTEDVDTITMNNSTVMYGTYLNTAPIGKTSIAGGVWSFDIWAGVSSATNVTSLTQNVNRVRPGVGTLTTTDLTATSKTATASTGTPFLAANVDVGGTIITDSFLQTPKGLYRILTRVDNTTVTIEVPATYTNEAGVAYSTYKRLFNVNTGEINNVATAPTFAGLQLYPVTTVQPAFTVEATDTLASSFIGTSTGARSVYFSHNGTTRYSHFSTPLSTSHNDLSGLNDGDYKHLTATQFAALHGVNDANTTSNSYADGKVEDSIVDGVTTKAPSQNAVYDALAGKQATLTFGIADTNAVKIDFASVTDNDYAKFTANGLEGRSYVEVLSDIGAAPTAHTHEGTAILSTGEAGGTKFLREDGDGTCSWQSVAGGTDEKVKYDVNDPTAGYVADKIVAGAGISVAEGTGATENKLVVTSTITQYTDELAQDAVGGMVDTTLTYTDGTPELKVTNPVTPQATGFTITAGTTAKTLTVADTASVSGTNTGDNATNTQYSGLVTNATHTGEVTGATALTLDKTAISNKTDTVITASDVILFGDATDTGNLKSDTVQGILDLVTHPSQVEDSIVDGHTTVAPSGNAVFDALALKAPLTAPTFATSITGSYLTASEILITDASKNIVSAPVATYPSLTELSYVKGLSSAIQTQLGTKAPLASPTFTGIVTLPKTLEIQDTSADHQYVLAVSELTADRTIKLPLLTGTDTFAFEAHTQTLTNKRINPRLVTTTSYTTDTGTSLSVATCDQFEITAQAGALKFNNPGGTPVGGNKLIIRIKDDGTAKALTYDTQFRAMGNALPSTTVLSKTLYMGFIFNATDTKWDLVAVAQEA